MEGRSAPCRSEIQKRDDMINQMRQELQTCSRESSQVRASVESIVVRLFARSKSLALSFVGTFEGVLIHCSTVKGSREPPSASDDSGAFFHNSRDGNTGFRTRSWIWEKAGASGKDITASANGA